jgi:hypothetical protein
VNYKKISTKREQDIAKDISGRRHVGSGNQWHHKGDDSNEFLLIEDKFVVSDKYSINLNILNKLITQANKQAKIPVLRFGFLEKDSMNNFACVEDIYCYPITTSEYIIAEKRSKTVHYNDLYNTFILSQKLPTLIKLTFSSENRSFYIIEWKDFLEFQEKVIVFS